MLKRLIILADQLDSIGYIQGADEVDAIIKQAQQRPNNDDLEQALTFYNNINMEELSPDDVSLEGAALMAPEDFLPGLDVHNKGWLNNYLEIHWPKLLTDHYGRDFKHIINLYKAGAMNPAIKINDQFTDGIARALFYNSIGEDMPVAKYRTNK